MDQILEPLKAEYDRWTKLLSDEQLALPTGAIDLDTVLRSHFLLCDYFIRHGESIATAGPREAGLLSSAIARQAVGHGGRLKWPAPTGMAATLFYGLVKNHPFYDGNKRTALLVTVFHLSELGLLPNVAHTDLEELVVRVAGNELDAYKQYKDIRRQAVDEVDARVSFIADFFRRNTRKTDARFYGITYNELEKILNRFGFELANPSGGFVDIVKPEVTSRFLGFGGKTTYRKMCQVGYPGGNREVTVKAMQTIRKSCGLTAQNGYDSQVFFKGADSLAALISRYHGPLTRLKDK